MDLQSDHSSRESKDSGAKKEIRQFQVLFRTGEWLQNFGSEESNSSYIPSVHPPCNDLWSKYCYYLEDVCVQLKRQKKAYLRCGLLKVFYLMCYLTVQ